MRLAGIKRHALLAPFTDHQDAINVLPNVDFLLTIADWRAVQCGHRSQDYRLGVGLYDNAGADLLGQVDPDKRSQLGVAQSGAKRNHIALDWPACRFDYRCSTTCRLDAGHLPVHMDSSTVETHSIHAYL